MALPVGKNLTIYKGDSYALSFRLRGRTSTGNPGAYVDLTGATAKAQIRATETSNTVIAEFATEIPTQAGSDLGRVNLSLTPEQTGDPAFDNGKWDVQILFPDGSVKTFLRGDVLVTKEITRA